MSIESQRILIGACGWQHSEWAVEFYPDDIPPEWQITYYANEFPVVLLRATDWQLDTNLTQLYEDVHEGFRFILELPAEALEDTTQLTAWLNHAQSLGDHCLALVYPFKQAWADDLDYVREILTQGKRIAPVVVDAPGRVLSDELQACLTEQQVSVVWHADLPTQWQAAPLVLTRISEVGDAKQLRKIVETCLSASRQDQIAILLFDGQPPSLENMRNAGIIVDLL